MPDQRQQLQQLLDHPRRDDDLPGRPAFTVTVMTRIRGQAQLAARPAHALSWGLAASVLAAALLISDRWLGGEFALAPLREGAPALDLLVELIIASLVAGALLLCRRRKLA